jgi:ABC-2 type transport system ATP-binding protein
LSNYVLEVQNLDKFFGKTQILYGIDFSIGNGEVYGLIGQNGAGKTTLIRLISGLMKPTHGRISINTNRPFIGYMPQSCRFDDNSNVKNTIKLFSFVKKANVSTSLALCSKLELDIGKKVKHLSPGQQKKLQIVIAMTGDPDFYVLDEPTAGLDPKATYEMMEIIKSIQQKGKSILVSSHILSDMDEICTHTAIIERGRLVHAGRTKESYIVKTSPVPYDKVEMFKKVYSIKINRDNTALAISADKCKVSELVKELTANEISVFEVSAFNVKSMVQQQIGMDRKEAANE